MESERTRVPAVRRLSRLCLVAALVFATGCACSEPATSAAVEGGSGSQAVDNQNEPRVPGFDVSHFQGDIRWEEVPKDHFVYVKASEGIDYVDPAFSANWQEAHDNGLRLGAYHMFRPEDDPADQAAWFVERLEREGSGYGDLPPALDLESNSGTSQVSPSVLRQRAEQWLEAVHKATGRAPVVYTNPSFWAGFLEPQHQLLSYPLWIASYAEAAAPPSLEAGWASWSFWQYSQSGTLAGIDVAVDLNWFNGDQAQLEQLLKGAVGSTRR